MNRSIFLTLLALLVTTRTMAQPERFLFLDSIQQEIQRTTDPEQRITLYLELAGALPPAFADSIHAIARMLPAIAERYRGIPVASVSDYVMGIGHAKKRNLDSTYYYMARALPEVEDRDSRLHVNALSDIAIYFGRKRMNDSAIHYLKLAEPIAETEQAYLLKKVYGNLGISYQKAGNYNKAIAYFEKVFALPDANVMDTVIANLRIGDIRVQLGQLEDAIRIFKSVARKAPSNSQFQVSSYHNVAAAFTDQDQRDSALFYLDLAFSVLQKAPDAGHLYISNRLRTANAYLEKGETETAKNSLDQARNAPARPNPNDREHLNFVTAKYHFKENRYDSVVFYGRDFLESSGRTSRNSDIAAGEFFEMLAASYQALKRPEAANEVLTQYVTYLKNNELRQSKSELADLRIFYETQEKENQLEASLEQLETNKTINWLLGLSMAASLLAFLSIGFTYLSVKSKNKQLQVQHDKIRVLIRELHHRVKNNLQVISSLLGLQSIRIQGDEARKAFEEGKSRVNAMAMIHKKLYQEEDLEKVNIQEYLTELVDSLKYSFAGEKEVQIAMEVENTQFNMDKAIPLGLILNELITNSFKYAFEDIEAPLLEVRLLKADGRYHLSISDNGKQLDEQFDVHNSPSFGLKLVNLLVDQLQGSLTVEQASGLKTFSIQFT